MSVVHCRRLNRLRQVCHRIPDPTEAIRDHRSGKGLRNGSEANAVIDNFNGLSEDDKQDLLNFLRSL
jgi:hypothetical protein